MSTDSKETVQTNEIDKDRRQWLSDAGGIVLTAALGGLVTASGGLSAQTVKTIRWGVIGTGGIANSMAPRIQEADNAELVAVSSRRMSTAQEFADTYDLEHPFDSWQKMLEFDGIDAVYIATPTSVREEIGVAAANAGKHVLGEKPFANLPSLKRIIAACREAGVGFMDGTHFPHHPRTAQIRTGMSAIVGRPGSVASAFQFKLPDSSNIRLNPDLEPYGAIGDAGWYNMRAAVEYLADDVELVSAQAYMRRHPETGASYSAAGLLKFDDGSLSTWNCGFQSGGAIMDLRITGPDGVIKMNDFLSQRRDDNAGVYTLHEGWGRDEKVIEVPSDKPGSALMFEDFAKMVADPNLFEASVRASERTQKFLDTVWESAVRNEQADS